jgi:hypothetical protein
MMLQLNPPQPLDTPKGAAWAVALIDYGPDHDLCWVCFVRETGECWTFRNSDIKQPSNITYGRFSND